MAIKLSFLTETWLIAELTLFDYNTINENYHEQNYLCSEKSLQLFP